MSGTACQKKFAGPGQSAGLNREVGASRRFVLPEFGGGDHRYFGLPLLFSSFAHACPAPGIKVRPCPIPPPALRHPPSLLRDFVRRQWRPLAAAPRFRGTSRFPTGR